MPCQLRSRSIPPMHDAAAEISSAPFCIVEIAIGPLCEPCFGVILCQRQIFSDASRKIRIGNKRSAKRHCVTYPSIKFCLGTGRVEIRVQDQRPLECRPQMPSQGIDLSDTKGSIDRGFPQFHMGDTYFGKGFEGLRKQREGSLSRTPWVSPFGERRTPTRSAPIASATACVASFRNRTRFSIVPPYRSSLRLALSRRNWSMR